MGLFSFSVYLVFRVLVIRGLAGYRSPPFLFYICLMSRAENRHDTLKWKMRRKHKLADKCGNAKCTICHSNKIIGIPSRQLMRENSK